MNKVKFILLATSLMLVVLFAISCSSDEENNSNGCLDNEDYSDSEIAYCNGIKYNFYSHYCSGEEVLAKEEFTDSRDGQKYRYVAIGSQIWMADNLNYEVAGGRCLHSTRNDIGDCEKRGRFYDWAMAMNIDEQYNEDSYTVDTIHKGICPDGWHIPSFYEWKILRDYSDYDRSVLKARCGWPKQNSGKSGNGMDDYGFSAQPTGYYHYDFAYFGSFNYSLWWTSNDNNNNFNADDYNMSNHANGINYGSELKHNFLSVRCIKDELK